MIIVSSVSIQRGGIFHVTTLIIPKQESTSSSVCFLVPFLVLILRIFPIIVFIYKVCSWVLQAADVNLLVPSVRLCMRRRSFLYNTSRPSFLLVGSMYAFQLLLLFCLMVKLVDLLCAISLLALSLFVVGNVLQDFRGLKISRFLASLRHISRFSKLADER